MNKRYTVEQGYFGVWDATEQFRFRWQAEQAVAKLTRQFGDEQLSFRVTEKESK